MNRRQTELGQTVEEETLHSSHWGAFTVRVQGGTVADVQPFAGDVQPSPLLGNFKGPQRDRARVLSPAVRRGWLESRGVGAAHRQLRGSDQYVRLDWADALDLLGDELERIYRTHGASAVYGGSYGWASAGRFHHAQSQIHRFLNGLGGYTASLNTYSQGASSVVMPHILGKGVVEMLQRATSWDVIAQSTELFVAFGGMALKNADVCAGGTGQHLVAEQMRAAARRGTRFVLISPQRDDLPEWLNAEWLPIEPGTDTALMLALAYELLRTGREDRAFLRSHCVGSETWASYLRGDIDGIAKTAQWAARLTGVAAERIERLALEMADHRTMINTAWSLQRSWFGEQPVWASVGLAAFLGQIGLPGGGVGHGYATTQSTGQQFVTSMPSLPQGKNPVAQAIPVARIADMLLGPGTQYEYNGRRETYPDIRMVYWCGGNPFHHHQDLNRLRQAFQRPETIVVHEPYWTATARHADIVLPATTTLERNDIGCASNARHVFAMKQALPPLGEARSDYAILSELALRLGCHDAFTEGRDERQWLEWLYERWRARLPHECGPAPAFDVFWERGVLALEPEQAGAQIFLSDFRADPVGHPLGTPSGKIEIVSERVQAFGYEECPGYAVWREPPEWQHGKPPGQGWLVLLANNPSTRLHSQLDAGQFSAGSKVAGREPIRMNPLDAGALGIADGDIVRVFNGRGSLLAGAVLSDALKPGVTQLATGAWLDLCFIDAQGTKDLPTCLHGNPNVLTEDHGTSRLSQGCVGQISFVKVERYIGYAPPQCAWDAPVLQETYQAAVSPQPTGRSK